MQTFKENWVSISASALLVLVLGLACAFSYFKAPDYAGLSEKLSAGNYAPLIAEGEAALKRHPDDIAVIHALAAAYLGVMSRTNSKEDGDRALKFLVKEMAEYPNDGELMRLRGDYYFRIGVLALAERSYTAAAAAMPTSAPAWSSLGLLYESENNFLKSRSLYAKALGFDSKDPLGNIGLIREAFRENRLDDARKAAMNFLSQTDNASAEASVYEILALDAAAQKKNLDAENYFRQALSVNPSLPVSLASLAQFLLNDSYRKSGAEKSSLILQAEALAKRAVAIVNNYSYGYAVLSRIETAKGDAAASALAKAAALAAVPHDILTPASDKVAIAKAMAATSTVTSVKIISVTKIPAPASKTATTSIKFTKISQ